MTASLQSTGPAHFFCGVGQNSAALYLGTAEDRPIIQVRRFYENVRNDIAGPAVPYDRQFMGVDGIVGITLSRWDQVTLNRIQSTPYRNRIPGVQPFGGRGAFMQLEGLSYPLWVQFPYATKTAMVAAGMPAGYRFPVSFLEGPDGMPVGTTYRTIQLAFYVQNLNVKNGGDFLLFDHDMAGLPPIT